MYFFLSRHFNLLLSPPSIPPSPSHTSLLPSHPPSSLTPSHPPSLPHPSHPLPYTPSFTPSYPLQSQNSTLVNIEQHYAAFNSHLDDLSVEKLLLEFVQAKGTGTEKPSECCCHDATTMHAGINDGVTCALCAVFFFKSMHTVFHWKCCLRVLIPRVLVIANVNFSHRGMHRVVCL